MQLQGTMIVSTDKTIVKTLWEPLIKTWFTEGVDDPRITALRFAPNAGCYWDTKNALSPCACSLPQALRIGDCASVNRVERPQCCDDPLRSYPVPVSV
jgi:Pyridoxamine 5'-phosphate oxidase like